MGYSIPASLLMLFNVPGFTSSDLWWLVWKYFPVFGLYHVGWFPFFISSQPAFFRSRSSSLYFTLTSFLL